VLSAFLSTFLSTSLLALQRNIYQDIYATADTQIRATKGQILRAAVSAVSFFISTTHGQRIWYEEHLFEESCNFYKSITEKKQIGQPRSQWREETSPCKNQMG
jgi:hypothetical protein